jgi:hypothetical protein
MEDQIFGFNISKLAQPSTHRCPSCAGPTVEILSKWKFEQSDGEHRYTGIFRCLDDNCDCYSVPSLPEVHA